MVKRKVRCNNCKALMTYNSREHRWECELCGNSVDDDEGLSNINGRNYY